LQSSPVHAKILFVAVGRGGGRRVAMTERRSGQELARRRLGSALRRHRERANVRLEAAARELECSAAKISRLENGQGPAKLWEIRVLMDLYGVSGSPERRRMEGWARDSKEPGWWEEQIADLLPDLPDELNLFIAAETEASRLQCYSTPVLPTVLQTADYAAAHVRALQPHWTDSEVDRLVEVRQRQQESVVRTFDPVGLEVVLDEGALRRVVGGPKAHRAQLTWLADTLDAFAAQGRDTVRVRVLPFAAGVPGRAVGPFTIIEPRDPELDQPMVLIESTRSFYWADAAEVEPLRALFAELVGSALDLEPSRTLIREVIEGL
jgi:hypothetical protein